MARQNGTTLSGYLEGTYLPSRPALRPKTVEQLRVSVRVLDRWRGRPVALSEATDGLLSDWLSTLVGGCAAATVNSKRRAVLCLVRAAWRARLIDDLPRDVPRMREPRRLPEAWDAAQVARLVTACRRQPGRIGTLPAASWWTSLVLVHYYTAPRISALMATSPRDLDPVAGWLLLRAESDKTATDQLYWLPRPALEELLPLYSRDRARVWPWPFHRRTLWVHFRRIVEAAGLPAPRTGRQLFYRLRRTTISLLAAKDLEAARRLAGHASAATTLRHYVDARVAGLNHAAELLPDVTGTRNT